MFHRTRITPVDKDDDVDASALPSKSPTFSSSSSSSSSSTSSSASSADFDLVASLANPLVVLAAPNGVVANAVRGPPNAEATTATLPDAFPVGLVVTERERKAGVGVVVVDDVPIMFTLRINIAVVVARNASPLDRNTDDVTTAAAVVPVDTHRRMLCRMLRQMRERAFASSFDGEDLAAETCTRVL
jgi:hypothetical protein